MLKVGEVPIVGISSSVRFEWSYPTAVRVLVGIGFPIFVDLSKRVKLCAYLVTFISKNAMLVDAHTVVPKTFQACQTKPDHNGFIGLLLHLDSPAFSVAVKLVYNTANSEDGLV